MSRKESRFSFRTVAAVIVVVMALMPALVSAASDGNSRCKCACTFKANNATTRTVSVKSDIPAEMCKCALAVENAPADCEYLCECAYENRNTTIIQVVVIGMITLISGLFVYMLFLLCLDPLINRRGRGGRNRLVEQDDGVNMEHFGGSVSATSTPGGISAISISSGGPPMRPPQRFTGDLDDESEVLSETPPGRLRLDSTDVRTPQQQDPTRPNAASISSSGGIDGIDDGRNRSSSVLNRLRVPHDRWQGQLQNQRHNVYSNRSVLN